MSRGSGLFNPVKLSADETEIIRKRESLRLRGPAWSLLILWVYGLFVVALCIPLERAGWHSVASDVLDVLLIVLAATAPVLFSAVLLSWWTGTYTLGPQRICQNSDLSDALRGIGLGSPPPAADEREVECYEVSRATVEPLPGPWQWFDIGHVVVSTRAQARALVLRYMQHPRSLADEIMRNAEAAVGAGGGNGQAAPRRLRRSFAWLFVWVTPGLAFLWGCVAVWIGLQLLAAYGPDVVLVGVFIAGLITAVAPFPAAIIAFLNWWVGVYVVTNRRVVAHKGLLNVTERVLSLDDVVSASATKAGLARYLGVGNVQVNTAGPTGVVKMVNISEPDWVRQQVLEVQQRVQQSRQQIEFGEISRRLTRTLHLY